MADIKVKSRIQARPDLTFEEAQRLVALRNLKRSEGMSRDEIEMLTLDDIEEVEVDGN